ncbi:MAG TPA: methylated-DNA--[protein]-cysteine S-methyltransferase [Bryobacteraceae bacterium]|nr:methylated-DNA--[protein]-cysteine S-methyltransferase [Bryobacteraceae bacterium]
MRQILYRATFETPIGPMLAVTSVTGLCALEFELPTRQKLLAARLEKWFTEYEMGEMESMPEIRKAHIANWLTAYFHREFPAPPQLDLRGSVFEQTVWKALLEIPVAQTTTYGSLAESLGIPGSARAIGTAVRRNPISLVVPCHRVVGSDGALRGYGGGVPQKQWLLQHEAR